MITGAEHPHLIGRVLKDPPVLAIGKVRFIGERVAAVAAETKEIAEAAIALVDVEYEALPAVFETLEALKPGAPMVHEEPTSYVGAYRGARPAERLLFHIFHTRPPRGQP